MEAGLTTGVHEMSPSFKKQIEMSHAQSCNVRHTKWTRVLTAVLLVGGVVALVPVVALLVLGDALVSVLAAELAELAGDAGAAVGLVALVPAVVVAVAPLGLVHAQPVAAPVVRVLAGAVVCEGRTEGRK